MKFEEADKALTFARDAYAKVIGCKETLFTAQIALDLSAGYLQGTSL